jgi:chitinase
MKTKILLTLALLTVLFCGNRTEAQFKIVGYIPNWINLTTFSDNFDFTRVTHLNIAFKDPSATGDLPSLSASEIYLINAAHTNGVKVLLSLCGGGSSSNTTIKNRYFTLISSANVNGFAQKLTQYTIANNLDGLDLDLEGGAINADYGTFVQVLADSLHPAGKLLTAALSQGYGGANVPNSTFNYFDWVNIMAYDACGPTWGTPGQHSSYSFASSALIYWKGRGLAKSKAVLGVPFYGYGFGSDFSSYSYSYNYIESTYPSSVYDDEAGSTIYYNGISTIVDKTSLAKVKGGGIMIWELSLDATGSNSLLGYIRSVAGNAVTETIEDSDDKNLSIYPNPSNRMFTIDGIDLYNAKIEIYNSLGEKIESGLDGNSLDLNGKPKGIYFLHIIKEEKITLRKIVLQ